LVPHGADLVKELWQIALMSHSRFILAATLSTLLLSQQYASAQPVPHEFLQEGQELMVIGACAAGTPPTELASLVSLYCAEITATQNKYRQTWLNNAREFFAAKVPAATPKTVVYPFAGGDLSSALAVFPDADEITTISLEPAGDPRRRASLKGKKLQKAFETAAVELSTLYRHSFSVTAKMIGAMRSSVLPTQLIFSLSALLVHDYELLGMRFFTINDAGDVVYMTDVNVAALDAQKPGVNRRNLAFGSVEIRFRKKGGGKEQVYRHLLANLDNPNLRKHPGLLRHLEKKGPVAMMTKAASYLLSYDSFDTIRKYITDHAQWMVSDTTGVAPKWGTPAGFSYETYGKFVATNMIEGNKITPSWLDEYKSQPRRPLTFRFGYPDRNADNHLIIMQRK
jgi:hypothetical protein